MYCSRGKKGWYRLAFILCSFLIEPCFLRLAWRCVFVPGEVDSRVPGRRCHLPARGLPDQEGTRQLSLWLCAGNPIYRLPPDAHWQQERWGLSQVRSAHRNQNIPSISSQLLQIYNIVVVVKLRRSCRRQEQASMDYEAPIMPCGCILFTPPRIINLPSHIISISDWACRELCWIKSFIFTKVDFSRCSISNVLHWTWRLGFDLPAAVIFQLHLLTTWGDPYYIGLNGLEFYDHNHEKIPLSKNSILLSRYSRTGPWIV